MYFSQAFENRYFRKSQIRAKLPRDLLRARNGIKRIVFWRRFPRRTPPRRIVTTFTGNGLMRWRDPDCEHHPTINVSGLETLKNLIDRPAMNRNRTA